MIKEQTIFLDKTPYNIYNGTLIKDNIESLNLIISDISPQTEHQLIGNQIEWKPLIWLEYEKERILKLKCLRIIMLQGVLNIKTLQKIKNKFKNVVIEEHGLLFLGARLFLNECKNSKKFYKERKKKRIIFGSIGTMRLNRFVVSAWSQKNKIDIYFPKINNDRLAYNNHFLKKYANVEFTEYKNVNNRVFGEITLNLFNKKLIDILSETYINFVFHSPTFDDFAPFHDEKLYYSILCKNLPFLVDNTTSNNDIELFGFKPYVGFNYESQYKNHILRWIDILNKNKIFFIDIEYAKNIYRSNEEIINFNQKVLIETDWNKKTDDEFKKLPNNIQKIIENCMTLHSIKI